jgi:hypothetical protein
MPPPCGPAGPFCVHTEEYATILYTAVRMPYSNPQHTQPHCCIDVRSTRGPQYNTRLLSTACFVINAEIQNTEHSKTQRALNPPYNARKRLAEHRHTNIGRPRLPAPAADATSSCRRRRVLLLTSIWPCQKVSGLMRAGPSLVWHCAALVPKGLQPSPHSLATGQLDYPAQACISSHSSLDKAVDKQKLLYCCRLRKLKILGAVCCKSA